VTSVAIRRTIHAVTSSVLLLGYLGDWSLLRLVLSVSVPVAAVLEVIRVRYPPVRDGFSRLVPVFRPSEATHPSGAFWLLLGFAAAAWFPQAPAAAGILAGAIADPAASLVGSRWGGEERKSWVGTAAAWGVSFVIFLGLGIPLVATLAAATAAAALERWPGPVDDNLLLPPGVAVCVWMLT
jgi:dolichol kinase